MAQGRVFPKGAPIYLTKTYSKSYSLSSSNTAKHFTSADLGYSPIVYDGVSYTPIGFTTLNLGYRVAHLTRFNVNNFSSETGKVISVWNYGTFSSKTVSIKVLFVRSDLYNRDQSCTDAPFIYRSFTASYSTIAHNNATSLTLSDFDYSAPSRYVPFCISNVYSGRDKLMITTVRIPKGSTSSMVVVRNQSGSNISAASVTIGVVFIRKDLIEYPECYSVTVAKGSERIMIVNASGESLSNGKFTPGTTVTLNVMSTNTSPIHFSKSPSDLTITQDSSSAGQFVFHFVMPNSDVNIVAI